jgi:putative addiction module component (TIGR02574 family)
MTLGREALIDRLSGLFQHIENEIAKLNITEGLHLIQNAWDALAKDQNLLPMPEWQKNELERRYEEYQRGDLEMYDWQTAHERMRNK